MRPLARSLAVVLFGLLSVLAAGLPASAQVGTCDRQDNNYAAGGVCAVSVEEAVPACPAGVLELRYRVVPSGTSATTVDLRWQAPGGEVLSAGLPLTGSVAWPATVPRGAVDVRFVAGGEATVRVDAAAVAATCVVPMSEVLSAGNAAPVRSSQVLAATGFDAVSLVAAGAALLVVGAGVLVGRSLRQRHTH
ncbi:hypothetical protein [Cellulomonas fimi]|uniref:LPXTG-motif cell wall anchor domain protein n=1 Tax=Cellulomonas fimi TaxID=1708 RepID=A0A7Y0LYN5_CELFI|nr:hypothetical protein [Cellulomonas fimi]NMR20515.1 hypothetical protein [Cellulomonas fimi]